MTRYPDPPVEITATIKRETEKAYQIDDGDQVTWIPKSQVESIDVAGDGKPATLSITEWIATQKGLI